MGAGPSVVPGPAEEAGEAVRGVDGEVRPPDGEPDRSRLDWDTHDMPVPGIEIVRRVRPSAMWETWKPFPPADNPIPDFEKFSRSPGINLIER
jgi:hypothetical protein